MATHFLGKKLLVITAHPDDEGIAAGTMYENHKAGGETYLICATYGEKGKSHLAKPVSDAALKRIRKNELLKAAKVLHVKQVFFLGLPDTKVGKHRKELFAKCAAIVREVKPDQLVSFGPDGMSGHLDHIAAHAAALQLAKKFKLPLAAATLAGKLVAQRRKLFLARRKFGKYAAGSIVHRKGDIKIKINKTMKHRAMKNHVSQFGAKGPNFPIITEEHFVNEKI
ncbi:MAG TPA: PIG-L family deacetylase [Candidatus Paceibacterota bacterium]|jgi:LmbE family N-acetylglucosaminyl deacetylase|nr:PIG-L family deacetylase [Candidatus Paceibacterota bacterium]